MDLDICHTKLKGNSVIINFQIYKIIKLAAKSGHIIFVALCEPYHTIFNFCNNFRRKKSIFSTLDYCLGPVEQL